MSTENYTVFTRNWWKPNPSWPNGLEPDGNARRTTLATGLTHDEARETCLEYNATHDPGPLSKKAEFTEDN